MNAFCLFCCFITIDPSLGRIDKDSLPQQTLMELVLAETGNKGRICGTGELSLDIQEWTKVNLNENQEVFEIDWYGMELTGNINLKWLPSTAQKVFMHSNMLTSPTLDLTDLPRELTEMYLSTNKFSGEVDLCSLPKRLKILAASFNALSGEVNLEHLPSSMVRLYLNNNQFVGPVNLTNLPKRMKSLNLSYNKFIGEIDCSNLPPDIRSISVENTQLIGNFPDRI